jgi:hypothetical protein
MPLIMMLLVESIGLAAQATRVAAAPGISNGSLLSVVGMKPLLAIDTEELEIVKLPLVVLEMLTPGAGLIVGGKTIGGFTGPAPGKP